MKRPSASIWIGWPSPAWMRDASMAACDRRLVSRDLASIFEEAKKTTATAAAAAATTMNMYSRKRLDGDSARIDSGASFIATASP